MMLKIFDKLAKRAEIAINLYTQISINDISNSKKILIIVSKRSNLRWRFRLLNLDVSGTMTADDKKTMQSVSIGRTSINYGSSVGGSDGQQYNLSLDAENVLKTGRI